MPDNIREANVPYYYFIWTDIRIEKVRNNGVDPDDVEGIISNPDAESVSRRSGLPIAFSTDAAGDQIVCIYELDSDGVTVYPITACYAGE